MKAFSHNIALCLMLFMPAGGTITTAQEPSEKAFIGTQTSECVVLLHGLARSSSSMGKLAENLEEAGYSTANIDYNSTEEKIEVLAPDALERGLSICGLFEADSINIVTHSMGGILVREYLENNEIPTLKHVVMLAPPNHGSEVTDAIGDWAIYRWINGPAGQQLGTDSLSKPNTLPPADFSVGIIAGTATVNPILSQYLPNPDDGKVSSESAKLDGMADYLMVDATHTFIMSNKYVIKQVIHFFKNGSFDHMLP